MLFFLNNAFGAEQFTQAVGRERVVLGFPGIGGRREGSTTKFYVLPQQPTTLGEVNGQITSRLRLLAAFITATGHPVTVTTQIDAWLKGHAVFVTCMAAAIDQCGGDSVRLAHTSSAVATMVRAIREGFLALQAQGVPVTPRNLAVLFGWMPSWFAIRYWQQALRGPVGTLAIAPHARAALSEMVTLAAQVLTLLQPSLLSTPTLHQLLATFTTSPGVTSIAKRVPALRGALVRSGRVLHVSHLAAHSIGDTQIRTLTQRWAAFLQRMGATRVGVWLIKHLISPLDRWIYQRTGGRLVSTERPLGSLLLLTTTWRRTGTDSTTPVFYLRDGDRLVLCSVNPGFERPNPLDT